MKILLYEWCCSGGLAAGEFTDIVVEGRAMLEALAADAARDPTLDVTVLVDRAQTVSVPARARLQPCDGVNDIGALVAAARLADATVIVAPETDGILLERVVAVRDARARVLSASAPFIAIAADKQLTAHALAAAGVPVPAGRSLAPGEAVPADFRLPAVLKGRDGVGGEGFQVVAAPADCRVAYAARLEAFVPGIPVGVSCLCGPGRIEPFEPMRQSFTATHPPRYAGGEPLRPGPIADRARSLAQRAVAAVTRAGGNGTEASLGWVGVDMIIGERDDGRGDRVLEVNPRVTTSFVQLAAASPRSLVRMMIDVADDIQVLDGAA